METAVVTAADGTTRPLAGLALQYCVETDVYCAFSGVYTFVGELHGEPCWQHADGDKRLHCTPRGRWAFEPECMRSPTDHAGLPPSAVEWQVFNTADEVWEDHVELKVHCTRLLATDGEGVIVLLPPGSRPEPEPRTASRLVLAAAAA